MPREDFGFGQAPTVLKLVRPALPGSVRGGRGVLWLDNSLSDVPITQPDGNGGLWTAQPGQRVELPTLTCAHCGVVVILHPQRTRDRGFCAKCNAYVCDRPGCRAACNPMERMLDLGLKYPDEPWLARGPQGEMRFDQRLADRERTY